MCGPLNTPRLQGGAAARTVCGLIYWSGLSVASAAHSRPDQTTEGVVTEAAQYSHKIGSCGVTSGNGATSKAVRDTRTPTDIQAAHSLFLDAQTAGIKQCCTMTGLKFIHIDKDALSGGKAQQSGLQDALRMLQRGADV